MIKRLLATTRARLLLLIIALFAAGAVFLFAVPLTPDPLVVTVPSGASLRSVAKSVAKSTVAPAWVFELTGRLSTALNASASPLKAGRYTLDQAHSAFGFWRALALQAPEMVEVKLVEGWTFKQIRAAINAHPELKHTTQDWDDAFLMRQLGEPLTHPEGQFFPDTYLLVAGSTDLSIYKAAFEKMKKVAAKVWATRPESTPLSSIQDLLNLAAIVEKETGLDADRSTVASVFHNRLKIGMRLQTDPTVIYGMGEAYQGRIRKADLLEDTPYNTYTPHAHRRTQ
jgi:UPF0755 protein